MTAVTQLTDGPEFRFAGRYKQGDAITVAFVIADYASLVSHTWSARVRGRAWRLKASPSVVTSLATTTVADDSVRVSTTVDGATTRTWDPGTYVIDIEDTTTQHTWGTGQFEILRDVAT